MSQKFLNVRAVCARYSNVSDRTIDRWVEAGVLPKPLYIQKQRYWPEDLLDQHDKARLAVSQPPARELAAVPVINRTMNNVDNRHKVFRSRQIQLVVATPRNRRGVPT